MNDVKNENIKIFLLIIFILLIDFCHSSNTEISKLSSKFSTNEHSSSNKNNNLSNKFKIRKTHTKSSTTLDDLIIEKPALPLKKLDNKDEELIPVISILADSTYTKKDSTNNIVKKYDAKNLLLDDYWCSAGNHGIKDEINLKFEFESSVRLSGIWLHWAYAPGEFRIQYSNTLSPDSFRDIFPKKFRFSIEKGNLVWWKKILSNPLTRWQHKSFDDRINLEKPVFAKYIIITLRIPVNKYYGLYRIEFYRKSKSVVMLKNKISGFNNNICMLLSNGEYVQGSPIITRDCIDSLSFGDNRDLFILHSNGYITSFNSVNRCIQSENKLIVNLEDCATSENYKDDRHKWSVEYTGLIRSVKDPTTCLAVSVSDDNFIRTNDMVVTCSSTEKDNSHEPENAVNYFTENYWASEMTVNEVIYNIMFRDNLSFNIKSMKILWKFPAKNFRIIGMLPDGNFREFFYTENNRNTSTEHFLLDSEVKGLKIIMKEASMRFEGKNIYAIINIYLNISGKYVVREKCSEMIDDVNLWEIEDINYTDDKNGLEYKKENSNLNSNIEVLKKIQKLFGEIPRQLQDLIEGSGVLDSKMKEIDEKMSYVKSVMVSFESVLNSLGDNFSKNNIVGVGVNYLYPAMDCTHIKIAFPHKRSGMYWIKNECMSKPLKLFCDFSKEGYALDIHFVKFDHIENSQNSNSAFSLLKKDATSEEYILEIKRMCANIGLFPLEIKNIRILRLLKYLIEFQNMSFGKDNILIFPIGFDYGIKKNGMEQKTGIFNSLNKKNSVDIKKFGDEQQKSMINLSDAEKEAYAFMDVLTQDHVKGNLLVFSSDNNLLFTKFEHKIISGIACSSNEEIKVDQNIKYNNHVELKCDSSFKSEPFLSQENMYNKITSLIVECPTNCMEVNSAYVYGKGPYTDHSSICRAAIHAGFIRDTQGGVVRINLISGQENYESTLSNGIDSMEYKDQYPRSFTFSAYKPDCPIDKFQNEVTIFQHEGEIKKVDKNKKKRFVNNFSSFLTLEELVKMSQLSQISQFSEKNINSKQIIDIAKQDDLRLLLRFLQIKRNQQLNSPKTENLNSSQDDTKRNSLMQSVKLSTIHLKQMTTEDGISQVDSNLKSKERFTLRVAQLSEEIKKVVSSVDNKLVLYRDDPSRGIKFQTESFKTQQTKIEDIKKLVLNLDSLFMMKIVKAEFDFYSLKKIFEEFMIRNNFHEDYTYESINTNYKIFNSLTGIPAETPAEWSYYPYNLEGRKTVIIQKNKFFDTRSGSHLIVRNRDFYDFEFKCSIFISKDNMETFGVVFRYQNEYTYYIFEISKKEKGFKRLRRFVNGEPEVLDLKYDGGYTTDEWIMVKIRVEVGLFRIYTTNSITSRDSLELESTYQPVFSVQDNKITHGTVGFSSVNMNFILIDDISVVQINCVDFKSQITERMIEAETNSCRRYRENYRRINQKFTKYDPLKSEDGPSLWERLKPFEGRQRVMRQKSLIYDISDNQEGTMNILKNMVCQSGRISLKLKSNTNSNRDIISNSNSSLGIVFKFVDENNFYVLEIFKKSLIRLRKKSNGEFHLIKINSKFGFEENTWFKIVLEMKDHSFNAILFPTLESQGLRVFDEDAFDSSLKTGKLGFWTYRTAAIFGDFEIDAINNTNVFLVEEQKLDKIEVKKFTHEIEIRERSHYHSNDNKHFTTEPNRKLSDVNNTNKNKSKYTNILVELNKKVKNFSWKKCLLKENKEYRDKECKLIFRSENDVKKCTVNFFSNNNFINFQFIFRQIFVEAAVINS